MAFSDLSWIPGGYQSTTPALGAGAGLMLRMRGARELFRHTLRRGMRGAPLRGRGLLFLQPLGPPSVLPLVVPCVAEMRLTLARKHVDFFERQLLWHRADL